MMARSSSKITGFILPSDISYSKASFTIATAFFASLEAIPTHIECSEEACVMRTTLIPALESTSKNRFEIPGIPTIPGPSSDKSAILSTWLIPRTVLPFSFWFFVIKVPAASGSNVFFITMEIPFDNTGCIVGGYRTLAPKWESSIASSYEIWGIAIACFTILGFAVYIPLTSVHISNTSAFRAPAIIAAVKSDPPLPKVVELPLMEEAINPAQTIIVCGVSLKYAKQFALVISKFTAALP